MTLPDMSYNKLVGIDQFSLNIINYLIAHNDLIFNLLHYTDNQAWDSTVHPYLTKAQKQAMLYMGQDDESIYNIFIDSGQDNAVTKQICILRIGPDSFIPTNYVYGDVSILFEVYCHYKINALSNVRTRSMMIIQQLVETLNGAEVGGIGRLYFDASKSRNCRMQVVGTMPFKGAGIIFNNKIGA
jgi:hypothetical protein